MTDREFWIEVYRGLGHIMKGFGTISAAIARRYALGDRVTPTTSTGR
jgi:hypothetical protein